MAAAASDAPASRDDGYCRICRADVPLSLDGLCLAPHKTMPGIPPTWGKRTQQFVDGAWVPPIPKPAGYVWRPKYDDPSFDPFAGPAPKACETCGGPFRTRARGVTAPRCCPSCRKQATMAVSA
jgi:hypothetical protein